MHTNIVVTKQWEFSKQQTRMAGYTNEYIKSKYQ